MLYIYSVDGGSLCNGDRAAAEKAVKAVNMSVPDFGIFGISLIGACILLKIHTVVCMYSYVDALYLV